MSIETLTDDLIEIACASRKGEMGPRLEAVLQDKSLAREEVAGKARYVIGLLRLQANSMEQMPHVSRDNGKAMRLGSGESAEAIRGRAVELRKEADDFEQSAIAAGLLPEAPPSTGRGLLSNLVVTDEDIEEAKRSVMGADDDNAG